jgi:Undecaprenyl-phosphate glucose phosphotransferase
MAEFDVRRALGGAITSAAETQSQDNSAVRKLSAAALNVAGQTVPAAYSPVVVTGATRLAEFILIACLGTAIYFGYVVAIDGFSWIFLGGIVAIAAFAVFGFQIAELYQMATIRGLGHPYYRVASAWSLIFLVIMALAFFTRFGGAISRVWLATFYVVGLFVLVGFRVALAKLILRWTRQGRLDRRTVIVGADDNGEVLINALDAQPDSDVRVIGVFDDRSDERASVLCAGKLRLGTVDDLVEFARRTRVDLVIFALPISAETRILQMLKKLWVLPVDIRLYAHPNRLRLRPRSYSYLGNVALLDVFDRPITDWDVVVKWLFDRVVGGLILLAATPVMALVAIAIKLDSSGPILFKQKRYGFNNEMIDVYKFRSLYADKTDHLAKQFVVKNDPRVTRVGRFIRKTSLDELPQLFNVVFKGNLSLVGPRPHPVYFKLENRLFDEAVDGYFARHRVKPGITGWAQINGYRGEINTQEKIERRVEFDLDYIENWSVFFDLHILAMTPIALIKAENAY